MSGFTPEARYCIRCGRPFQAFTSLAALCEPCVEDPGWTNVGHTAEKLTQDPGATVVSEAGAPFVDDPGSTVVGDAGATLTEDQGETVGGSGAKTAGDPGATIVGNPGATVVGEVGSSGVGDAGAALDLVPGTVLTDTYEVLELLGRGGMGAVHRVRHLHWEVDLAVKTPLPEVVARHGLEGFIAEANAWVDLGLHPNVVTCHYVRVLDGIPRVFAEYVAGGSLQTRAEWAGKRAFAGNAVRLALDVAVQIAWGLGHAHGRGLVHQDVKPANVLMTPDGVAKVTDFGIAGSTVSGRTPEFAAPEQRYGASVTSAVDVYSFGLTLLSLLWGGRSWAEGGVWADATADDLLSGAPARQDGDDLPRELAGLVSDCLAGDPAARPDLSFVADRLVEIYETLGDAPFPRTRPRESDLLAASLNNRALSLIDLGREDEGLDALRQSLATDPLFAEAVYNDATLAWCRGEIGDREVTIRLEKVASAAPRDWRPHLLLAEAHEARGDVDAALAALTEAERRGGPAGTLEATAERLSKGAPSAAVVADFAAHVTDVGGLAIDAGQSRLLSAAFDGSVVRWDIETGEPLWASALPTAPHNPSHLVVSADGSRLLYTPLVSELDPAPTGPGLLDTSGGVCMDLGLPNAEGLAFSTDRRWALLQYARDRLEPSKLAAHGGLGNLEPHFVLVIWDLEDGHLEWQAPLGATYTVAAAFSPDSTCVTCADSDGRLRTWHLASARPAWCLEGLQDAGRFVCWYDDEGVLLCHSAIQLQRTVTCLDPRTGEHRFTLEHDARVSLAIPAAGGRFVVSATGKGDVCVWNPRSRVLVRTFELWDEGVTAFAAGAGTVGLGSGAGRLAVLRLPAEDAPEPRPALARVVAPETSQERGTALARALSEAGAAVEGGDPERALRVLRAAREDPELVRHPAIMDIWRRLAGQTRRVRLRDAWMRAMLRAHDDAVLGLAVSPQGTTIISAGGPPVVRVIRELQPAVQQRTSPEDFRLRLWEPPTGRLLTTLDGHADTVRAVDYLDERHAVSVSDDGRVLLWDLDAGVAIRDLGASETPSCGVAAVRSGHCLVLGDRDDVVRLRLVDAPVGARELAPAPEARNPFTPHAPAATMDARLIARAAGDGAFELWEPVSGALRVSQSGEAGELGHLAFSPDGLLLVAGRADGSVVLADTETLAVVWEHPAHGPGMLGMDRVSLERPDRPFRSGETPAVAFSPDGRYVASGGADRLVRVWNASTGECVVTLQGHDDEVACVAFDVEGGFIASGGWDGRVILWDLDWEYEVPAPTEWETQARPYLDLFLELQSPTTQDGITPAGRPIWGDADLDRLRVELGRRGLGNVPKEALGAALEDAARQARFDRG